MIDSILLLYSFVLTGYNREIKHDMSDLLTGLPSCSSVERAFAMLSGITSICWTWSITQMKQANIWSVWISRWLLEGRGYKWLGIIMLQRVTCGLEAWCAYGCGCARGSENRQAAAVMGFLYSYWMVLEYWDVGVFASGFVWSGIVNGVLFIRVVESCENIVLVVLKTS